MSPPLRYGTQGSCEDHSSFVIRQPRLSESAVSPVAPGLMLAAASEATLDCPCLQRRRPVGGAVMDVELESGLDRFMCVLC